MARPTLGLDLGGSAVKWVLLAPDDTVLDSGSVPTPQTGGAAVVELLATVANGVGARAGSIAVGIPGHVDRGSGTVVLLPNIPGEWPGFPLGAAVSERVGRPVTVLNDARAHGHAELRLGAARGRRRVLFAAIGTGVGGAIALDGAILTDTADAVGEFGHLMVEPDGVPCGCGALGCLETVASAPALIAAAARAVLLGLSPALQAATAGRLDRLTPAMVADAARSGDDYCRRLLARAGRALGGTVGAVCSVLALDTVVIGGGATGAVDLLLPQVRQHLDVRAPLFPAVSVRRAVLGPTAGAVGAALCARDSDHDDRDHDNRDHDNRTPREELDVALDH